MVTKAKVRTDREAFLEAVLAETERTGIGRRRMYAAMSDDFRTAVTFHTYCTWVAAERQVQTVPAERADQVLAVYKQLPGLRAPVSLGENLDIKRFNNKDILLVDRRVAFAQVADFLRSGDGQIRTVDLERKVGDRYGSHISKKAFDAVTQPGGGRGRADHHLTVHRRAVAGIMVVMRDDFGIPFGPTSVELVQEPKPDK